MSNWYDPAVLAALVTGAASIALVIATLVLAAYTKAMADRASEPFVVASIEPNRWSLMHADIVVANTGSGAAFDIRVSFDPAPAGSDGPPLKSVSVLRPGQAVRAYLNEFSPLMKRSFKTTVQWRRTPGGRVESTSYQLDMSAYDGFGHLGASDPLIQIAEQVKKMREDWDSVARGNQRLSIDVYDNDDREAEQAQREAWRAEALKRRDVEKASEAQVAEQPKES